jgi:putative transposase
MAIRKDTLDQLLAGRDPRDVFAKDGLVDELKKALANRVLNAGMDDHLEAEAAGGKANRRNGYSAKTVTGETGKLELRIPRDREGTFDPKLIAADSDEVGHGFRFEPGHVFRPEVGQDSDLMSATLLP